MSGLRSASNNSDFSPLSRKDEIRPRVEIKENCEQACGSPKTIRNFLPKGNATMIPDLVHVLLVALIAGVVGGAAMEIVLWLVGTAGWAKADMIVALGSLLTRSRVNAWKLGAIIHSIAAVSFAILYTLLIVRLGYSHLPYALVIGIGIGFWHGLIVSLGLVWVVAERHPLEEFTEAGLAIGLSHVLGHVAYGAVVGLVIGIAAI